MFDGLNGFFGMESETGASNQQRTHGHHGGNGNNQRSPNQQPAHDQDEYDEDDHEESANREDLLDQHVAYYMKHHPEVHRQHQLTRIRPGAYNFDGREITVEWHYADQPGEQGYLIAIDGPLRQPFADYMQGSEKGVQYDDQRLVKSSLSQIAKGQRMSFGDTNKVYSRLEAMKVAKEQALVREKAAEFSKVGMEVPQHELMSKYQKTISQKLGERRQRAAPRDEAPQQQAESPMPAPVAAPPAEAPRAIGCPPEGSSPAAAPTPNKKKQQTHGAPKYCEKHNDTTQRKKCKPRNLPCATCQTVIQTNYVEFTLCPTCSEKDHRCMCCGAAAVGAAPSASPKSQPPASPMAARGSPQAQQSPAAQQPSAMSPLNLFGMPDLLNADVKGTPQGGASALFNQAASAFQGATKVMSAQNGGYAATNPMASASPQNNAYASASPQNVYSSQNAFASYSPQNAMASQNIIAGAQRRF